MFLHLHRSCVDAALASETSRSALGAIENLLLAYDAQKHYVGVELGAKALLKAELSARARGALQSILQTLPDINGLRKSLPIYVEIGVGSDFDGRLEQRAAQQVIRANLGHFDDFERAGLSILLGEDDTDAEIYEALAKAAITARGLRVMLAFDRRGGSGSNMPDAYAGAVRSGKPLIAIIDSDRRYPGGPIGHTTPRGVREKVREVGGHVVDLAGLHDIQVPSALRTVLQLHARMLENLVPFEVYEAALVPHSQTPSVPERLMKIRNRLEGNPEAKAWRWYVNFKEGLRLREIDEMDSPERAYWQPICEALECDRCSRPSQCEKAKDCACWVIDKPGDNVAAAVARWLRTVTPTHLAKQWGLGNGQAPITNPELERLVEYLICWGLAPKARRST